VALFFGITYFANGIAVLQNTREFGQFMHSQFPQAKDLGAGGLRAGGVFTLLCGFSISLNVFLNFRLLRWYFFMKGMV
jgi:hypothetical protein